MQDLTLILALVIVLIALRLHTWHKNVQNRKFCRIYNNAQALKQVVRGTGSFFQSPYASQSDFLDYIGQFFKYKKHEWIFVAFMRDGSVDQFWLNKGPNAEGVSLFVDTYQVVSICKEKGYNHVLVGHNHPGGALAPSKQDRVFLEEFMDALARGNVSVEHLVFVAGAWQNYGLSMGQHIRRFFKKATFSF